MKRTALIVVIAALAVAASRRTAHAQAPAVSAPESPDQTIVEGAGVKVGEGTVLHPVVGVETGYVSNVFFSDQNVAAPLLRVLAELNFASLSSQRLESADPSAGPGDQGDLSWRLGLRVVGQEYLTSNDNVGAQHNIAGGLSLHGLVFPHRTWRFGFDDDYIRDNRPTNYESSGNLNRDINSLQLAILYAPEGRALSGALRYSNRIDVFEKASHDFANRIQHSVGVRVNWQWLPITKLFADLSFGVFGPLGSSSLKTSSYPLRGIVGINTAITVDTALNMDIGYANGFYSSGESFSNLVFNSKFAWRYLPTGQLFAGYSYDFTDSVQANYFRDHAFIVGDQHQFGKITSLITLDARLRGYRSVLPTIMGPPDRDDLLFDLGVSPRYYFRDWFAATLDYDLLVDSTDYRYTVSGATVNPSYVRHQIMAGVRAAW